MNKGLKYALSEIRENYNSLNWWRNRVFVPYVVGTLTQLHPSYPGYDEAIHVMEEDWDNLIVLDACRADEFERAADLNQFDEYSDVVSLGSHSSEWTRRNFAGREFGDTVYVSANPHTSRDAGGSFHTIVEMWNRDFDDNAGTVPPQAMVDAAREAIEEFPNKRLIVHFMQPHGPFIGTDIPDDEIEDRYWEAYDENLAYVLEYVEELIADLPGRTVITGDHGQISPSPIHDVLGVGGHKPGLRYPGLVRVPWAVTRGERRRIVSGSTAEATAEGIDERLRDLGYKV
ncbi:hypothetical protein DVK02_04940 [Halobellus sp. Atlit-31R]|nr:hypothetical protein DVK02_04940 [Halobellus sp. Atlit-31R]